MSSTKRGSKNSKGSSLRRALTAPLETAGSSSGSTVTGNVVGVTPISSSSWSLTPAAGQLRSASVSRSHTYPVLSSKTKIQTGTNVMSPSITVEDSDDEYERSWSQITPEALEEVDSAERTYQLGQNVNKGTMEKSGGGARGGQGNDWSQAEKRPVRAAKNNAGPSSLGSPIPTAHGVCPPSDDEEYFTASENEAFLDADDGTFVETDVESEPSTDPPSFTFSLRSREASLRSISTPPASRNQSFKLPSEPMVSNPSLGSQGQPSRAKTFNVRRGSGSPIAVESDEEDVTPEPTNVQVTGTQPPLSPPPVANSPAPAGFSVIAHNADVQRLMDEHDLSWGTQFEIARGVSDRRWTWAHITADRIRLLRGPNGDSAHRVEFVILGRRTSPRAQNEHKIWAELDREQAAITENKSRGLGLQGEWVGIPNWFGGQVQQVARVVPITDKTYELRLLGMETRKSHRFARYLGSRRILQFKLPKKKFQEGEAFLAQKFVLCGRVFVPFCVKDGNVHLAETNTDFQRSPAMSQGDQYRVSFEDLIRWHNPMHLNGNQPVNKWIARFDLGFSTSVPVLAFTPENIHHCPDDYAPYEGGGKVPTEKIYTDGCGFMNGAALMAIARQLTGLGYDRDQRRPTAVQGRVFGSKGVWMLHPTDHSPDAPARIWIRPSQVKVKLVPSPIANPGRLDQPWNAEQIKQLHPAHLIFDLVAPSKSSTRTRLNRLAIMNLSHNGVPVEVLSKLMKESLENEILPLMEWDGPHANTLLFNAIDRVGHVTSTRILRQAAGMARALGLTRWIRENSEKGDDDDDGRHANPNNREEDDAEGPESVQEVEETMRLHEKIVTCVQAGFSPLESAQLYDDLRVAISMVIDDFIHQFRMVVPESADAFIVPDPYGVLEEGQIHFKSSQNLKDPLMYQYPDVLTGEVLIYRNPCRLPSDVQKVMAVQHPSLSQYTDVIVLPVKGEQSLASLLAGGDVDGDVGVCIFDKSLVEPFVTPQTSKEPPNFQASNFKPLSGILKVSDLERKMGALPAEDAQALLQRELSNNFGVNFDIGGYSKSHENAAYAFGYDHDITVRLAFMFNTVLDSRKTGLEVNADVLKDDRRRYNRDPPPCMSDRPSWGNSNTIRRQLKTPFVLEQLLEAGKELQREHLMKYQTLAPPENKRDEDLSAPYRHARELIDSGLLNDNFEQELEEVKRHVHSCCERGWQGVNWDATQGGKYATEKEKKDKADVYRQVQQMVVEFSQGPPESKVPILTKLGWLDKVRASCAYTHKPKFAFAAALHTLCLIKAEAKGIAPMTKGVGQAVSVPASAVRIFSAQVAEFGAFSKSAL